MLSLRIATAKALRTVHNDMSCEVLEILPLPFLITASSCARDNLAAVLGPESKRLHLTIKPPNGILRLDLDFRCGNLRRIILHVHRPAAGFFASKLSRPAMAAQIDTGLDLALWVTGKPSQPNRFAQEYALGRPRYSRKAPLADLYAYIRKEREEGRILRLDEYEPAFLGWVRRYMNRDPASILSSGASIGASVVKKIGSKITAKLIRRHSQGTSKAVVKMRTDARPRLKSRPSSRWIGTGSDGSKQARPIQALIETSDDSSSNQKVYSRQRGPMKTVMEPVGGSFDGINHMEEINDLEETQQLIDIDHQAAANEEFDFHFEQEHCLESLDHINKTACEVEIPEPMDDQLLEEMPFPYTGADVEASQEFIPDIFHGTEVIVQASGTVKLVGRYGDVLFFRMSTKQGQILSKMRKPTVSFWPTEIKLQIGDQFIYEKPIERLLSTAQGPQWLAQYCHEMEAIRAQTMIDQGCGSSPGLQLTLPSKSANTAGGTLWKNGELQRKLRQGSILKCTPMKNGTESGRVCVRGVQLLVPPEADFNPVAIQCEITPEGNQHANQCGAGFEDGDPARRLGVRLKYTCRGDNKTVESWAKLNLEGHVQRPETQLLG